MPLAGSVATINYSTHPQPFAQCTWHSQTHIYTQPHTLKRTTAQTAADTLAQPPSIHVHTRDGSCNFICLLTETDLIPVRCSLAIPLPLSCFPAVPLGLSYSENRHFHHDLISFFYFFKVPHYHLTIHHFVATLYVMTKPIAIIRNPKAWAKRWQAGGANALSRSLWQCVWGCINMFMAAITLCGCVGCSDKVVSSVINM